MIVRPALKEYRTWSLDSRRWQEYRPRADDIVIATYPKCGTTWMQRIVDLLLQQSTEARSLGAVSPWIDARFREPIESVMAKLDAQAGRRFVKSHLPFDGLPVYDNVKYIHVARDGRDACISLHNQNLAYTPQLLARFDQIGMDEPLIARPIARASIDPAVFFRTWLTEATLPSEEDGLPILSFFKFERTYWRARSQPNLLLVHFNDLKTDLDGEMRRISKYLDIPINEEVWPSLVRAAVFETMRRDGNQLMPQAAAIFEGGAERFFHKGTNDRWGTVFRSEDLALYETKLTNTLGAECAAWVTRGRIRADGS